MDVSAQCGTTAGRGKNGVKGGKGEVGITGVVTIATLEEAVVKGVSEREGHPVPGDVSAAARAVSVVTGRGTEAVGVRCGEGVIEEELHTRAKEAT